MSHEYPKINKSDTSKSPQGSLSVGKASKAPATYPQGPTAIGSPRPMPKPKAKSKQPTASVEVAKIPALVPDPFEPHSLLDLTAAELPNFNLVDGTVRVATDPHWPFVLFKGYNPDTFFYAPRWGKLATNPQGEPAFTLTKKVRNNPDGSKTTLGGVLTFMVELVTELPDEQMRKQWQQLIKNLHNLQPSTGAFSFQPLRLTNGKMVVSGLDMYAIPGQRLKDVDVGAADSIGFAIELNPDGADHFAAMLGASPLPFPPQVAINFTFKYQYFVPECVVQAHGSKKKTYDYFSYDIKARASYFGLVNGSFDYASVQAKLREIGGLTVSVVGTPPQGVDLQKLIDSAFDMYVKMLVGQWIQPDPKPVEAPEPGGFFGGVSVAMKSVNLSDEAQFDETINFAGIKEDIFNVSFNFEQQIGSLDAKKHLFVEEDDIKLPFKLAIGSSEKVKMVVPSASYTSTTGPRSVQCRTVDGGGGLSEGIIQFTWPQRPTSAQISLIVDFNPPFGAGYEFRQTQPVSDTGAAFLFEPDQFVQRTRIFFIIAATVTDLTSKALFKWEWTPPQGGGTTRPKVSGFFLIAPDQNGTLNNLPTYDIEFPYHPDDWTGETTPKIQYKVQGLTGEWKSRTASGAISIGETSIAFDWSGISSIGETLAIPALLTQYNIPDPSYKQRLASQFGHLGKEAKLPLGVGASTVKTMDRSFSLGYSPSKEEPMLFEREIIARSNLASMMASEYSPAYPASYDLRDVDGQNFITPIRDQAFCGACVSFGTCAAVEGTLQVRNNDPNLNPDFSEAHLFYCLGGKYGRSCGNKVGDPPTQEPNGGWWPGGALDEFQSTGVVDEACFPYASPASSYDPTLPCNVCDDWESRVTRIRGYSVLSSIDDMKAWISGGKGPLVGAFTVYQDFMDYFRTNNSSDAIYYKSENPGTLLGGHCICVVGYSDDEQCWICKNSWGEYWAASGFFKIGYGEVGIDSYMWGVDIS